MNILYACKEVMDITFITGASIFLFYTLFKLLKFLCRNKEELRKVESNYAKDYNDLTDKIHAVENFYHIADCAAGIEVFRRKYKDKEAHTIDDTKTLWSLLHAQEDFVNYPAAFN